MFSSQIEELGSEGRVEEAQGMMKLVEQLKEEREQLSSTPSVSIKPLHCFGTAFFKTCVFWHRSTWVSVREFLTKRLTSTLDFDFLN